MNARPYDVPERDPNPPECPATLSGRHVWRTETVEAAIARRFVCACCGAER